MSPSATGGFPHTRATSTNGGGPISMANSTGVDGMKGVNRVFAHLDDLVSVKPDVDQFWPIKRIVMEGDLLAKQADTHLDFRRPDIALQEYVKASIVAVEIIPRHKDYIALQSDRGELHRLYMGLNKRINTQHAKFADVKKIIQENNSRSGVKPTSQREVKQTGSASIAGAGQNGHARSQSVQTPLTRGPLNGEAPRKKPPVQPKPNALHGNAINPLRGSSSAGQSELEARFARLRNAESNGAVQDPRIRTRPISIPESTDANNTPLNSTNNTTRSRPTGPREIPSVPKTAFHQLKGPLNVQIPAMPRAPDAIYSPARNTDSPVTANLPTSVPRSTSYLGKQHSAPPVSTVGPTPGLGDNRQDYFSPAHTVENDQIQVRPEKRQAPILPDLATVSAEDLMGYLKLGSHTLKVLLVDIRSREEFDSGHIMSHSIICVEPITLRPGISGEQLGDSMIIAPDMEQNMYDQREDFDLVVYYDQSAISAKDNIKLQAFAEAIYEYSFEKKLPRRPMLLIGGLDAWIDLLGPNSLQTPISSSIRAGQSARHLGHVNKARQVPLTRRKTHSSRPLSKEEEKKWDQTLREDARLQPPPLDEDLPSDELVYARTTEDFFRRFPELPAIQESMVSPVPPPRQSKIHEELVDAMPAPPKRPAPALPRQRSIGLSEKGPDVNYATVYAHSLNNQSITATRVIPGLTGLQNPGVLCYMNSAIQALSATPFFRDLILNYQLPPNPPIPRKDGESSDPPQLMVRVFKNLLTHVWSGQYDFVTPKTLARYINSVHAGKMDDSRVRNMAYGGNARQHDSGEFIAFLLEIFSDEMNLKRNLIEPPVPDDVQNDWNNNRTLMDACRQSWLYHMARNDSPIARNMEGQSVTTSTCTVCHKQTRTYFPWNYLLEPCRNQSTQPLLDIFTRSYGSQATEAIEDYECLTCKKKTTVHRDNYFSYLPNHLLIFVTRYNNVQQKFNTKLTFPEFGLDLTPYFAPASPGDPIPVDLGTRGPFLYDCYAVIQHAGGSVASGHYWTVAKSMDKPANAGSGPGAWHSFNDSRVTPTTFAATQGQNGTIMFFKRRGA